MDVAALRSIIATNGPDLPVFVANAAGAESFADTIDVDAERQCVRLRQGGEGDHLTAAALDERLANVDQSLKVWVCGDDGSEGEAGWAAPAWFGLVGDALSCLRIRRTEPTERLDYDLQGETIVPVEDHAD